jgi:DNA polymerase epsilon subunit 1
MPFAGKKGNGFNTRFVKPKRPMHEKTTINESSLGVDATSASRKFENAALIDKLDSQMGFDRFESGSKKVGWLVNFHSVC